MKLLKPSDEPQTLGKHRRGKKDEPRIVASSWTQGQVYRVRALKALVWVLVVCGPVGLFMALSNTARPSVAAVAATEEPVGRQQAMELAQTAVVGWLTADRAQEGEVAALLPSADLPAEPMQVSNPTAADVLWQDGAWVVTVAVTITTTSDEDVSAARRFFQIPVTIDEAGFGAVVTLPAEVAGPVVAEPGAHPYRRQVAVSDPVALAAGEFLAAMLAGEGDLTRYTAPEANIRSVTPAPYRAVAVESVNTAGELSEDPVEGAQVEILVRAKAEVSDDSSIRLDYLLTMTLRSSRWEVTTIHGAPPATAAAPIPVPVASSSPSPSTSAMTTPSSTTR